MRYSFGLNTNILETNVLNTLIVIRVVVVFVGDALVTVLSQRRKTIVSELRDLDTTRARAYSACVRLYRWIWLARASSVRYIRKYGKGIRFKLQSELKYDMDELAQERRKVQTSRTNRIEQRITSVVLRWRLNMAEEQLCTSLQSKAPTLRLNAQIIQNVFDLN